MNNVPAALQVALDGIFPKRPYRHQRLQFVEQEIVALKPDAKEASDLLDALICAIKAGHDEAILIDVLDHAEGLKQSLDEMDARMAQDAIGC